MTAEDIITRLPYWARVAYAARCGRLTLPLFDLHWPDAGIDTRSTLADAVQMAENAAATRVRVMQASQISIECCMVAGRAHMIYLEDHEGNRPYDTEERRAEPHPKNAKSANIAFHVAKIVESAIASAGPDDSETVRHVMEAYQFLYFLCENHKMHKLLAKLNEELGALDYASKNAPWTDDTPVFPQMFEDADRALKKPWWKFW